MVSADAEGLEYKAQADEKTEWAFSPWVFWGGLQRRNPSPQHSQKKKPRCVSVGIITEVKYAGLGNQLFNNRQKVWGRFDGIICLNIWLYDVF